MKANSLVTDVVLEIAECCLEVAGCWLLASGGSMQRGSGQINALSDVYHGAGNLKYSTLNTKF
jgi:hypothetical protein